MVLYRRFRLTLLFCPWLADDLADRRRMRLPAPTIAQNAQNTATGAGYRGQREEDCRRTACRSRWRFFRGLPRRPGRPKRTGTSQAQSLLASQTRPANPGHRQAIVATRSWRIRGYKRDDYDRAQSAKNCNESRLPGDQLSAFSMPSAANVETIAFGKPITPATRLFKSHLNVECNNREGCR